MTSGGGRHLDAGAKTVSDDSPLKVAAIKAKEALMKRIYNSTCLEIPRSGVQYNSLPVLCERCGGVDKGMRQKKETKMSKFNLQ